MLLLASNEKVSHIKNFLPGDPVGVARMSETLWDVVNLLRLGWTSSAASRLRKLASKCNFQEWPRKIQEIGGGKGIKSSYVFWTILQEQQKTVLWLFIQCNLYYLMFSEPGPNYYKSF